MAYVSRCHALMGKLALGFLSLLLLIETTFPQESSLSDQARVALERGAKFYREKVATEGTYVWQYSEDLQKREGEGKVESRRGWVQPPGTPVVGNAYLEAYRTTTNAYFLEAARETAAGLLRGQFQSGGWHYAIEFDPAARAKLAYRVGGKRNGRNVTTLDDDTTTAALRFLMRLDETLKFEDPKIHEAVEFALRALFQAQYPNGAWPQGYTVFPDPTQFPVMPARYPDSWPKTWPGSGEYWLRYTFNDGVLANMIATLFEAARIYGAAGRPKDLQKLSTQARQAAEKAGGFILVAQMPEPQPAWAQQYDFQMQPCWARKFEPPAVTGGESQGALRTLLDLYEETGDAKYLKPIPTALAYLQRSRLEDGKLARFYELRTNRPLYFTRDYQLTFEDSDLPTHYGFKVADDTAAIERRYRQVQETPTRERGPTPGDKLVAEVRRVVAAQDGQGRWVEDGRLRFHGAADPTRRVIRSATFARNMEILSGYLRAAE